MKTMMRGGVVVTGLVTIMELAPFGAAQAETPTGTYATVLVENARSVPVVVYLERGALDVRLGTVPPRAEQPFALPGSVAGTAVRLVVSPRGELDLATQGLRFRHGQTLRLYVPTNDVGYLRRRSPQATADPGTSATTVTVQNHRGKDVTLYIERGAFDFRVGTVPANGERTLDVPTWLSNGRDDVELLVHPVQGYDLASQMFAVRSGAHLLVKVPVM